MIMKTTLAAYAILLTTGSLVFGGVPGSESQAPSAGEKARPKEEPRTEIAIPQSVFETSTQFLDPFHPKSIRRVAMSRADEGEKKSTDSELASLLILNGLSGSSVQRLAIVNGKTIAAGENSDVLTQRGKVKVHCLEIRASSVVVAVGTDGTKVELKLKD